MKRVKRKLRKMYKTVKRLIRFKCHLCGKKGSTELTGKYRKGNPIPIIESTQHPKVIRLIHFSHKPDCPAHSFGQKAA